MEFKHCIYYKQSEKQEHCPFSCCCETECIFTLQGSTNKIKEMENIIEYLEDKEHDFNALRQELDGYSESLKDLECENEELLLAIVNIIKDNKIKNYDKYIDKLNNSKYIKARL